MKNKTCAKCLKPHQSESTNPDELCLKCTKWAHIDFMVQIGFKQKLSCVPNCYCEHYRKEK